MPAPPPAGWLASHFGEIVNKSEKVLTFPKALSSVAEEGALGIAATAAAAATAHGNRRTGEGEMARVLTAVKGKGATWLLGACVALAASGAMAGSAAATPGVAAWGGGANGELGNGNTKNEPAFVPVSELTYASSVAAGGNFALGLLGGGTVEAWGSNSEGQLGIGKSAGEQEQPVPVSSLSGVEAVAAGGENALALLAGGSVETWGSNTDGVEGSSTPKAVPGISEAAAVAAGSEDRKASNAVNELALLASGEVYAWGNGEDGQLGDGQEGKTANSVTPVKVLGLPEKVIAISAGGGQNLALLANHTVVAWGENNQGQLGIGSYKNQDLPVRIPGLEDVVAISAGYADSLALLANGTVMAWGDDGEGELGPTAGGSSNVPVPVGGLEEVSAISAGQRSSVEIDGIHNLALLSDGHVMAWGGNKDGALGDESEGGISATPVEVSHLTDATSIAAGARDSFAVGPPVPIVTSVEPSKGVSGTRVEITGTNLAGATSVQFGSVSTEAIEEDSETLVIVAAPPQRPRTVGVTVTAFGTSDVVSGSHFLYEPVGTLEFGSCARLGKKKGDYKKGCTEVAAGGGYEWTPGVLKSGFTVSTAKGAELVGGNGALIVCDSAGSGHGTYSGLKSVVGVTLTFKGCGVSKSKKAVKCSSPGAGAGEVRTTTLEGGLGFQSLEKDNVALELLPAEEGQPFLTFTCGTTVTEVRGEVLAAISPVNSTGLSFSVKFAQSRGKQRPEGFYEGPAEVLEASVAGGPFEQAALSDGVTLTSEEALEINTAT